MAKVLSFQGLLPTPKNANKVAAVPYDVVNTEEAAELAKENMLSFLRVSRPEIELEQGIDPYDDRVYEKAAENFRRLCDSAPLIIDESPHLYLYSLTMEKHTQTGIVGTASVTDYDSNIIKKHEKTRKEKEDDRTRHLLTLRSHTGPVFLTYKDIDEIDQIVAGITEESPLFSFTAPDKIQHWFWRIDAEISRKLTELFDRVPYLYIADGHHRAAAASRAAAKCRDSNPGHTGKEKYNYFLAVIFPSSQLQILPYNRIVKDLNGLSPENFMAKIVHEHAGFTVNPTLNPSPDKPGEICMYLKGAWYKLSPNFNISGLGLTDRLDVSILQNYLLFPVLGIENPRTSARIDFIGGIRGTKELEKLVDNGNGAVAFSMYPITVEQLMAIADGGEIMPPKSTWFEPKLRDGLVCHNF